MKINRHIIKLANPFSSGSWVNVRCSGVFLNEITRAALLTVVLGITVVLSTGCASTSMCHGVSARLISPVTINQQTADAEENDTYQPARSPGFNEFLGG
jgi:hypothetical protein